MLYMWVVGFRLITINYKYTTRASLFSSVSTHVLYEGLKRIEAYLESIMYGNI